MNQSEAIPLSAAFDLIGRRTYGLAFAFSHTLAALTHGRGAMAYAIINGIPRQIPTKWWKYVISAALENNTVWFDHFALGETAPIRAESITLTRKTIDLIVRKASSKPKTLARIHQPGGKVGGRPKGSGVIDDDYIVKRAIELVAQGHSKLKACEIVGAERDAKFGTTTTKSDIDRWRHRF